MFCPKCGSQNSNETKFCRGCGTDLGNVLAIVEGKIPDTPNVAEKQIALFASGIRNLMLGAGFVIVSAVSFGVSTRSFVLGIFALAFAFIFLSTGISRMVQSSGLKKLRESRNLPKAPELTPGATEYVSPTRSLYETDDLTPIVRSVTEITTRHLGKKNVIGDE